jgi:alpha-L-rhamnosidase
MLARSATTLWESFAPTASLCHGFSTTPLYQLSTEVLGVAPLAPGFARFRVAPQLADLAHARGVFPTVRGDIHVAWVREGDRVAVDLTVPEGTAAELVAPPGCAGDVRPLGPGNHRREFVIR